MNADLTPGKLYRLTLNHNSQREGYDFRYKYDYYCNLTKNFNAVKPVMFLGMSTEDSAFVKVLASNSKIYSVYIRNVALVPWNKIE